MRRQRNTSFGVLAGLVTFLAVLSSCVQVLGDFKPVGTGGASSATGTATSSSGMGGTGGTGGAPMCTACAAPSNCPMPASDCATATCDQQCCGTKDLAADTPCSTNGGHRCDGHGACVACVVALDCPTPTTLCDQATCTAGGCGTAPAPGGTSCNDSNGKVCDGSGNCVACHDAMDCGPTGTVCATPACASAACAPSFAPAETKCTESGGAVCDGSGKCVACVVSADCPATGTVCSIASCGGDACSTANAANGVDCNDHGGTVCNGMGKCVVISCTNGIQDGTETDKDCGGLCGPCANSKNCNVSGDCTSAYCKGSPGVCSPCSADSQCPTGDFCDTAGGGNCTPTRASGKPCTAADQCGTGFCASGVCCNMACTGTCQGCTMALTGAADGFCSSYSPGSTAPTGQCPASPPCGDDGKCAAGGACEQAASTTACGSTTCNNGMLTMVGSCSGTGTCNMGTPSPCAGGFVCQDTTSCKTACSTNSDCATAGYICQNPGGVCVPGGTMGSLGSTCTTASQCGSGFCAGGVCCASACTGQCQACTLALTGSADGTCATQKAGTPAAPATGYCAAVPPCGNDGNCAAGGACEQMPTTVACGTTCASGKLTPDHCDGNGACIAGTAASCPTGQSCANGTACTTTTKLVALGAGATHTCAVTSTGAAQCWGDNQYGQLGNNSTTESHVPVAVTGLTSGVAAITAGAYHSCALTTAGAVFCWGSGGNGQLGNGGNGSSLMPVAVTGLGSGVTAIAGSGTGYHTCARTSAGAAMCWGDNFNGDLGNNSTTQSDVPVTVSGLSTGVASVATGYLHGCALLTAGGVKCWGSNSNGQLGNNTTTDSLVPVSVSGLSNAASLTSGDGFNCARTTAGAALCWGYNGNGGLGNNTSMDSPVPVPVSSLSSGVTAIAAGSYHACALITGGAVQCWGDQLHYDLGNTSPYSSFVPVGVSGLPSGVTAIAAGEDHTCALIPGGVAQCWGNDSNGQLGNNATADSSFPVTVIEP